LLLAALFLTSARVWTWLLGLQWLIGIGVDYLLAERFHPFWSTMFVAADSLDGAVGASVATFLIRQPAQPRIRQVLGFFAAAGLGAAASALLGALCAVNVLGDANYLHQWQIWWAGNWLGSLAIAPVVLTWAVRWRLPDLSVRTAHRWDLIAISIVLMGMTQWIFSATPGSLTTFLQLPSMLLAILIVAAFRLPPRWSTTLAATAVLLASYHSSQGLGPFTAQPDLFARIGSLQFFLATLLVFTFMLATVLLEKQRTFEQLTTSEERYRQFVTHSSEAVWRVELDEPMPLDCPWMRSCRGSNGMRTSLNAISRTSACTKVQGTLPRISAAGAPTCPGRQSICITSKPRHVGIIQWMACVSRWLRQKVNKSIWPTSAQSSKTANCCGFGGWHATSPSWPISTSVYGLDRSDCGPTRVI
jgi:integral membrane sensor domain MASE1